MAGCRCPDCTEAHRVRAREYRRRKNAGEVVSPFRYADEQQESAPIDANASLEPGPVESGVEAEIGGVADGRPGLAAVALAMARLLDESKAKNQAPAAAKVLASLLDKLRSASARGRRGRLALVRTMSDQGGAGWPAVDQDHD